MGFNKVILQSPIDIVNEYKRKGRTEFVSRYAKYDGIIGPSDSVTFLNTIFDFKDESSEEIINTFVQEFEARISIDKN